MCKLQAKYHPDKGNIFQCENVQVCKCADVQMKSPSFLSQLALTGIDAVFYL
jgi:hypothetical protein